MSKPRLGIKFLIYGNHSPFGRGVWKVGRTRSVRAKQLVPCFQGLHYCARRHLGFWVNTEMFWFEDLTPEETIEHKNSKLVTRKGRVVERVELWTPDSARELQQRMVPMELREIAGLLRNYTGEELVLETAAVCERIAGRLGVKRERERAITRLGKQYLRTRWGYGYSVVQLTLHAQNLLKHRLNPDSRGFLWGSDLLHEMPHGIDEIDEGGAVRERLLQAQTELVCELAGLPKREWVGKQTVIQSSPEIRFV